jgi:hypothetical protein
VCPLFTGLIAAGGVVLLLVIAVSIGMSLDTAAQRRERQRLAEERRLRVEAARGERPSTGPLCDRCPYRDTTH